MAQFDVYETPAGELILDCQADLLSQYNSRIVVPLVEPDPSLPAMRRLNPILSVNGSNYVMMTEFLTALPVGELGGRVTTLRDSEYVIKGALDMLISGY